MSIWPKLETRELPLAPHWLKAIGVGVVVMGMAMGTGELILWPHLIVKHGLGLLWLALIGITLQYLLNQEIARHTLATGESFFTSSGRILHWLAPFWIVAAILLYVWPGWASVLGTILAKFFGFGNYVAWAWASLAAVLLLTFRGRIAYKILETTLKTVVPIFVLLLVLISTKNLTPALIGQAVAGLLNFGYIPAGVDWNVLMGAIVFAGAGGMLNLCVSLWYRDKGVGMAHYAGRIENPVTGRPEAVAVAGYNFELTTENLRRWRQWFRYIMVDQGLVFWLLGLFSLVLLSLNAYAVLSPLGIVPEGTAIAVAQAEIFSAEWGIVGEKLYLLMAYLMLFSVMWTVLDALTRIVTDVIHTNARIGPLVPYFRWAERLSIHHLYYSLITILVFVQALLLPFSQPLGFLVISSVLGGVTMALYTPLLFYLNRFKLPKELRPGWIASIGLVAASAFYIYFAVTVVSRALGF